MGVTGQGVKVSLTEPIDLTKTPMAMAGYVREANGEMSFYPEKMVENIGQAILSVERSQAEFQERVIARLDAIERAMKGVGGVKATE